MRLRAAWPAGPLGLMVGASSGLVKRGKGPTGRRALSRLGAAGHAAPARARDICWISTNGGRGNAVERAKRFQSRRRQAVRLPRQFRCGGSEVPMKRVGKAVVPLPLDDTWDSWAEALHAFSEDYLAERRQPAAEEQRDGLP